MDLETARRVSIPAGESLRAPSRMVRSARRLTEQSSTAPTAPSQIPALPAGRGRLPSTSMEFGFATEGTISGDADTQQSDTEHAGLAHAKRVVHPTPSVVTFRPPTKELDGTRVP